MRGDGPKLFAGSADRAGIEWPQSGYWDGSILCEAHERALGRADEYAVQFIRSFSEKQKWAPDGRWLVPDTDCDLLVRFAVSVLWRYSISHTTHASNVDLGSLEGPVGEVLFSGGDVSQFGLWIWALTCDPPAYTQIYFAPYSGRAGRLWRFAIGGLLFQVSMPGYRSLKFTPTATRLNGRRVASGHVQELRESEAWEAVLDIGANMLRGERGLSPRPARFAG